MSKQGPLLKGWRFAAFVSAVVGTIGLAIYPIIIQPFYNQEEWKKLNKQNRDMAGIKSENVQPGNMKVWTDPFDRPGKPGNK